MKTNTYDLNLYVIDGQLKVLAHELEFASDGHVQAGSKFHEALSFTFKRKNKELWMPILEFFGETEIYDELDSWYGVAMYDEYLPFPTWEAMGGIAGLPDIVTIALSFLPEYEMHDWR